MGSFLARFISRPIFVLMVSLTIAVIGLLSLVRLPLALMPEGLAFGNVSIWISANDLGPEQVEKEVYEPLEGELLTIAGVVNVSGHCDNNGCRVRVELSPELDPRLAAAEVRDRIQRARAQWPDDVDRWFTWRETSDSIPLMFFGFSLPDNSPRWYDLIDKEIVPKLESLDGVGQVSVWGMVDESVRIFFDRDRLRQMGLNLRSILARLRDDNLSVPVGEVEDTETSFLVRADLRYRDLEAIRQLPIGRGLRLADVADVERVRSYRDRVSRLNGKYATMGIIRKSAAANTVEASQRVRAFLDDLLAKPQFGGLQPIYMFDQGEFISHSVNTLVQSAMQGGALAFIVLFLFLRRLGMTLVVILATPLSLLVAIAVLFFNGDTLNLLSMAGLTISLGMLVDNSIVVLENIYRLRQTGLGWRSACVQGVREVGVAVFLATLTTVAVFLPVIFASDHPSVQRMMLSFGLPLCAALLASLFVALVLLPATTAFMHRRHQGALPPAIGRHGPVALFAGLHGFLLHIGLRHRVASMLLLAAATFGGYQLCRGGLERGIEGEGPHGQIEIGFEFPRGTTLAEASRTCEGWERWLEARRTEYDLVNISNRFDRREGEINLSFPVGTPQTRVVQVKKDVEKGLPPQPGIKVKVRSRVGDGTGGGDGTTSEERGFALRLTGHDAEYLRTWAQDTGKRLLAAGLSNWIDHSQASAQDEVRINIARDRMQEYGVQADVLLGIVTAGLRGMQVSRIRQADGRDLRLIAEYKDGATMELAELKELQIWAPNRGFRRLGDLAEFEFTKGYESLYRRNGMLTTWINGERPDGVDMERFQRELGEIMKTMPTPRGYRWDIDGGWRQQRDDEQALVQAFLLGVVLVILVMGVLFESVILPLAVIATLPFAITGGLAGFVILGKMQDNAMWFGLLILAGVIVNNGIVLLDHIVRLQQQGMPRDIAVHQGVRDRMRAILMTACTTIVGLLPMIFVDVAAQRGVSYVGIATVVASGLLFGTLLTPLVVPITYTMLDDLRTWGRRIRSLASRGRTTSASRLPVLPPGA